MKTKFSLRACEILLLTVFWFGATAWAGLPTQDIDTGDEAKDAQALFVLLVDGALDFDYFLSELNIVKDQKKKLKEIAEKELKHWLVLQAELMKRRGAANPGAPSPERMNPINAFQLELVAKVNEVLLPLQMQQLKRLLRQRTMLQMFDFEGFELVTRNELKLEMSPAEEAKLTKISKQVREDFIKDKRALVRRTWEEIKPEMPGKSTEGLSELLSLLGAERKSRLRGERISFSDLKNWTKIEFANYETRCFQDAVYSLMRSDVMREQLGIVEYQKKQMIEINSRGRENAPSESSPEEREKMIAMAASGDVEGLKKLYQKRKNAELVARQDVIDEIVADVLLPEQVLLIRSIAKFKRSIYESKYGDEFGAAIAWSNTFGGPDFDTSRLKKLVESGREKYYTELKKLRKTAWEKTVGALPTHSKKKFESEFGEFYDYQSEKTASWDAFRSHSK